MYRFKKSKDAVMRKPSKIVEKEELLDCVNKAEQLRKVLKSTKGMQGISAPQLGISKCIVICILEKKEVVMLNPTLIKKYGKKKSNEGCLSVETGRYIVTRPKIGKVSYMTLKGEQITRWFSYRKLRIICHEIDHLNGISIDSIGVPYRWKGGSF